MWDFFSQLIVLISGIFWKQMKIDLRIEQNYYANQEQQVPRIFFLPLLIFYI